MGEKAEYRNAIRSRTLIRGAFAELINEKDAGKITVTDIVRRADINRGTFYAHYGDPMDVARQIEDEIVEKLGERIENCLAKDLIENPMPILLEVGQILEGDFAFYRLLISAPTSGGFLKKIRNLFVDRMMNDQRTFARYRNRKKFFANLTFFAGGMEAILENWFYGKIEGSFNEVAAMICDLNPYRKKTGDSR